MELYEVERAIKKSNFYATEMPLPHDDKYYNDFHDKIMSSIEKTEIKPQSYFQNKKDLLKRHWRFYLVISFLSLVTLISFNLAKNFSFSFLQNSHVIISSQNEDQIISIISSSPEMLTETVLSYKSEQEFIAESVFFKDESTTKELFNSL